MSTLTTNNRSFNLIHLLSRVMLISVMALAVSGLQAQVVTISSIQDSYLRSAQPDGNFNGESRFLIGYHHADTLFNLRGVMQFDLSGLTDVTVDSVTVSLTTVAGQTFDQAMENATTLADIELFNLGASFDETTVTWNSLTPAGGPVETSIATIPAYNANTVSGDVTFASTSSLVSEVQAAIDNGDGYIAFLASVPFAEASGGGLDGFYRFEENASITINYSPVPEASSYAILMGLVALGAIVIKRRRQ